MTSPLPNRSGEEALTNNNYANNGRQPNNKEVREPNQEIGGGKQTAPEQADRTDDPLEHGLNESVESQGEARRKEGQELRKQLR